jgi:hypothetical protein
MNRAQRLQNHINNNEVFINHATQMKLLRSTLEKHGCSAELGKIMAGIKNDLMYLQNNTKITHKK